MLNNAKALVVVLFFAIVVLRMVKPLCLQFMSEADFSLRRTVWVALTATAFLSPSFWLYVLVAIPLLLWAGRKDSNPAALFVFLFYAVPNAEFEIPKIFLISHTRILILFLALPALLAGSRGTPAQLGGPPRRTYIGEIFIVLATFFCLVPYLQIESVTSVARRMAVDSIDGLIPMFLMSRTIRSTASTKEAIASFVLSCAIMAPIAAFEVARNWLLYVGVGEVWGYETSFSFLTRGGVLRSQLATGHSLRLGFCFAMGFCLWLYVMRTQKSLLVKAAGCVLMWVGMLAAYGRGAWIAAVIGMFVYLWQLPKGFTLILKAAFGMSLLGVGILLSPVGDRIFDSLPFVGTVDSYNVLYRQQLFQKALEIIPESFWFGDLYVEYKLESLRQGQGIIDIVNGYLNIALYYGMVPLFAVVGFYLNAIYRAWRGSRNAAKSDADTLALGAVLVASLLSSMTYIWMAGFIPVMSWIAGMAFAYARSVNRTDTARPAVQRGSARRRAALT